MAEEGTPYLFFDADASGTFLSKAYKNIALFTERVAVIEIYQLQSPYTHPSMQPGNRLVSRAGYCDFKQSNPAVSQSSQGRPGYLTDSEQQTLEALKKDLASTSEFSKPGQHYSDSYVLRFLRARQFDLSKSKAMISESPLSCLRYSVDVFHSLHSGCSES